VLARRHAVVVTSVEDPAVARMAATGEGDRRGGSEAGLPTGTAATSGSVDVYRRAAAERSLLDADGVADVARRAGAEVIRGLPEEVPPRTADAYLRAKAAGRL